MPLDSNSHIDREQLRSYLDGSMTAEERLRIESLAEQDPFLKDALDGAGHEDYFKSLEALDSGWSESLDSHGNGHVDRRSNIGPDRLILGLASVLLVAIGLLVYGFWEDKQQIEEELAAFRDSRRTLEQQEAAYADSLEQMAIELARPIPEQEQVGLERLLSSPRPAAEPNPMEELLREGVPETLDTRSIAAVPRNAEKGLLEPMHPVYYRFDLKLADVRNEREASRFLQAGTITGTPASSESRSDGVVEEAFSIDYASYLDQGMEAFGRAEYKTALPIFLRILDTHPDDPNALFYAGLGYFNLDRCERSVALLTQSQYHESRVFDQESEWFRSLLYARCGDLERAQDMWKSIVEKNGFYAPKAASRLSSLSQ